MLDSDTAILDSDTFLSSLRFTPKHSPSTLTLTQTNSIWFNLMMAAILNSPILNSAILESAILHKTLTQTNSICWNWWWQPSWILPCWILPSWIQPFCTKFWLKLIQSDSNLFILTQLDDGSHLEFYHVGFRPCHLGFRHHVFFSQIHSKTLSLHSVSDSN